MNTRGSALVNVLIVVAVLSIVGMAAYQVVRADSTFAITNRDGTQAFHYAEGGIDYGMHLLRIGEELNQPHVLDMQDGQVEVLVEPGLGENEFIITSKGTKGSATRTVRATLLFVEGPFEYSLFVGGEGEEKQELKNFRISGPVHIASDHIEIDGIYFEQDAHFDSNYVKISNDTQKSDTAIITREEHTEIEPPNHHHWSNTEIYTKNYQVEFPQVDLELFSEYDNYEIWPQETDRIRFIDLKQNNYFTEDITIEVRRQDGILPWETIVIVGRGNVYFDVQNQYENYYCNLIVMADGDIDGVEKVSNTDDEYESINMYLYAKGTVTTGQNMNLRSIMAQVVTINHNQQQLIREPQPEKLPPEIAQAWISAFGGVQIIHWEN
ncbi:MAG: hypothetical protein FH749_05450 [Firmicutes bacterium]|nr:hypothetical protein [Bacillota bacterium]